MGHGAQIALRQIRTGEEITSDYLKGIPFMSTHESRIKLLQQKLFLCKCQACKAPCTLRAFACPKLACGGRCLSRAALLGEDEAHGGNLVGPKEWICQKCGDVTLEQLFFAGLFQLYKQLDDKEIEGSGSGEGTGMFVGPLAEGEAAAWLQVEDMWVARSYSKMYWSHDQVCSPLSQMPFLRRKAYTILTVSLPVPQTSTLFRADPETS